MITLREVEAQFAAPVAAAPHAAPAAIGLLHIVLFLTILISPLVFIEPSPYEAAVALLGFACVLARVSFSRRILPLLVLLMVWNAGGALALLSVLDMELTARFASISIYMALTAIIYACLFAEDSMRRLTIMRRAYLIAAAFAVLIGIGGYFGIIPQAEVFGRARSTFKDPNVFGPFLVLPLLFLMESLISRGARLLHLVLLGWLAFGLFLSFSRGAWFHFVVSTIVMMALMFLTAPDTRTRLRLIVLGAVGAAALGGLLTLAISFESIGGMFKERAKLVQEYDVSSGGRFKMQETAIGAVLDRPAGMGPYGFAREFGLQQHNVYLQAFLVYGWIGGLAYIAMVLLTLVIGFRAVFVPRPWQPYLITAVATFTGEVAEGIVIDSDHWRHFFLLLGIIWGLAAANAHTLRTESSRPRLGHA